MDSYSIGNPSRMISTCCFAKQNHNGSKCIKQCLNMKEIVSDFAIVKREVSKLRSKLTLPRASNRMEM
ncbi:hypothetical protein JHK85_042844 [Glycine max]|uniref:Uncharacterized protein n=1 Tax=Glycine max TaxID=3847 RepID=K7MB38_SOYBN|nr:hypothetical protein JHK85_042844 [Glycine max]KAH1146948.1 hypothetical protein GYH30_042219 [Glycine max]